MDNGTQDAVALATVVGALLGMLVERRVITVSEAHDIASAIPESASLLNKGAMAVPISHAITAAAQRLGQ